MRRPHIKRFWKQTCVGIGPAGEACYEALAELDNSDTCLVYSITRWSWTPDGRAWPQMTEWMFTPPDGWVKTKENV